MALQLRRRDLALVVVSGMLGKALTRARWLGILLQRPGPWPAMQEHARVCGRTLLGCGDECGHENEDGRGHGVFVLRHEEDQDHIVFVPIALLDPTSLAQTRRHQC